MKQELDEAKALQSSGCVTLAEPFSPLPCVAGAGVGPGLLNLRRQQKHVVAVSW